MKRHIYTPENDDGLILLNEKLLEIRSVYLNADIIIAGDLNARTKDFLDFIPNDDLDFVLVRLIIPVIYLISIEIPKICKPIINLVCPLLTYVVNMIFTC